MEGDLTTLKVALTGVETGPTQAFDGDEVVYASRCIARACLEVVGMVVVKSSCCAWTAAAAFGNRVRAARALWGAGAGGSPVARQVHDAIGTDTQDGEQLEPSVLDDMSDELATVRTHLECGIGGCECGARCGGEGVWWSCCRERGRVRVEVGDRRSGWGDCGSVAVGTVGTGGESKIGWAFVCTVYVCSIKNICR